MPGFPVSEALIAYWLSSYSPRYKENAGIISRTVIQCSAVTQEENDGETGIGKGARLVSKWMVYVHQKKRHLLAMACLKLKL